jgi:hypothetical protein
MSARDADVDDGVTDEKDADEDEDEDEVDEDEDEDEDENEEENVDLLDVSTELMRFLLRFCHFDVVYDRAFFPR